MEDITREVRMLKMYEELKQKRDQLDDLYSQLGRSLKIKLIWPQAFDGDCTCSPILLGQNWPNGAKIPPFAPKYPHPYERVRKITRTFLRRSDGVERDIPAKTFFSIFEKGLAEND